MRIMLLNDSETFTDLDGCRIVDVIDGLDTEGIEELLRHGGGETVVRFDQFGFEPEPREGRERRGGYGRRSTDLPGTPSDRARELDRALGEGRR